MQPKPWSHSSLEDFVNCPRAFYEKRIAKSVPEEPPTEQQLWGLYVHKAFEERQRDKKPLPEDLEEHEDYMKHIESKPGRFKVELKVGLTKKLEPCEFFAPDVWHRQIIDYVKIDLASGTAFIVDYKTGKMKNNFQQLHLNALYVFYLAPQVNLVNCQFYWTQIKEPKKSIVGRDDIPKLWSGLVPNLKQYVEAFKTDTWQPRQSGLCNGWCPVRDCEFWKPKRLR